MATHETTLYDTAPFGTTADTAHVLFQSAQGSSPTRTKSETNMRGAGSLADGESFNIYKIGVVLDQVTVSTDYADVWENAYLEVSISNNIVFEAPLRMCADANSFGGHYTQASASNEAVIGLQGNGYMLRREIEIPKGTNFRVVVFQGKALNANDTKVKVVLYGDLMK